MFCNYQLGVVNSFLMSRTLCFANVIVLCYSVYIFSFTEITHPAKLVLPLMSTNKSLQFITHKLLTG